MDAETKQVIEQLEKKLTKKYDRELKIHRDAVNKLAREVLRQSKLLKTARENIRIAKRDIEGVRGSLRRL